MWSTTPSWPFFSGLKIIATGVILLIAPEVYPKTLNIWLMVMMGYDGMNIIGRYFLIRSLKPKKKEKHPVDPSVPVERAECVNTSVTSTDKDSLSEKFQLSAGQTQKGGKYAIQVVSISRFFYIGLLIWAQVILFEDIRGHSQSMDYRTLLFDLYITFGYIYVVLPVLFFIIDCLFVLGSSVHECYVDSKKTKEEGVSALPKPKTDNLVIFRKYTVNLSGSHNCGICVEEYKNEDNLIQLQCNVNHHFHERCLTKWMEREDFCPTCHSQIHCTGLKTHNSSFGQHEKSTLNAIL